MPTLQRVLHVEDDGDIQEVARMTLEAIGGFTVGTCTSGAEALTKLADFGPDLILLDVMMPEMDGPTTLARLRELPGGSNIPVVFMTAKVQSHETRQYLEMGAIGVVIKPFDPLQLCDDIRAMWARACG